MKMFLFVSILFFASCIKKKEILEMGVCSKDCVTIKGIVIDKKTNKGISAFIIIQSVTGTWLPVVQSIGKINSSSDGHFQTEIDSAYLNTGFRFYEVVGDSLGTKLDVFYPSSKDSLILIK
jgi:hypothetical protein